MSDSQDLQDLKDALVAHFTKEHQRVVDIAGQIFRSYEQEKEEALRELRKEQDKAIEEALAHLEAEHAKRIRQQQNKAETEALAERQRYNQEKDEALAGLQRQIKALEIERDEYKEFDAQMTKRLLDAVNPVLCWVRLRGPRKDGSLPPRHNDTTVWMNTDGEPKNNVGKEHYKFYHTEHQTHMMSVASKTKKKEQWPFDRIFLESDPTSVLWQHLSHFIRSAVNDKRNAIIVAYGQTGSGKSTTMFNDFPPPNSDPVTRPLLGRTLDFIYHTGIGGLGVKVMAFEQYNESLYDLSQKPSAKDFGSAKISMTSSSTSETKFVTTVDGVQKEVYSPWFKSADAAEKYINKTLRKRYIASTAQNDHSSRSHTMISLLITDEHDHNCRGRVNLVDLAGKEGYPEPKSAPGNIHDDHDETERKKTHNSIMKSLLRFQQFIQYIASARMQNPSPTSGKLNLRKYRTPLEGMLKFALCPRFKSYGGPLAASIVIIGHVSTERINSAQSKGALEWLHGCRWHGGKGENAKEKPENELLTEAQSKAQQWEDFAREKIDYEVCQAFAGTLSDPDSSDG